MITKTEGGGHWYDQNGKPVHEVAKSSGDGMRKTTLADAKRMNLYPSVTTRMKILSKDNLIAWRLEQAIVAALTLPKEESETLDDFAKRVVRDSEATAEQAAKFGTMMHDAIEKYLQSGREPGEEVLQASWAKAKVWLHANIASVKFTEEVFVHHPLRTAGTIDLCAEFKGSAGDALMKQWGSNVAIADFKTRNPTYFPLKRHPDGGEWRYASYVEDQMQLWAYSDMAQIPPVASIYIARDVDVLPQMKVWSKEDMAKSEKKFRAVCAAWDAIKEF